MARTITLYRVEGLTPDRNSRIDSIDTYLSTKSASTYGPVKVGYQPIAYKITIKLKLSQIQVGTGLYNYAKLIQDGSTYYFFITNASWTAKMTVKMALTLDTINTYWNYFIGSFNPKTTIIREHRDRWSASLPVIDRFNEGFNPTLTEVSTPTDLTNTVGFSPCYLIWLANSEITPEKQSATPIIPCLCTDTSYTYARSVTSSTTKYSIATTGLIYFVTSATNNGTIITGRDGASDTATYTLDSYDLNRQAFLRAVRIYASAGVFYSQAMYYTGDTYPYAFKEFGDTKTLGTTCYIKVGANSGVRYINMATNTDFARGYTNLMTIDNLDTIPANLGNQKPLIATPFSQLDRSSTHISSILKLPYSPIANTNQITGFIPGFNLLRLPDDFKGCEIVDRDVTTDLRAFTPSLSPTTPNGDIRIETKLWNSEFYQRCYMYGDDQFTLKYENFTSFPTAMSIYFTPSKDMTNDFRWEFGIDFDHYRREDPYEEYMFTNASTQIAQYNSSYIDYIRNGYNYDQWANKKNNQLAIINTIGGFVGAGLQIASPIMQGATAALSLASLNRAYDKWGDAFNPIYEVYDVQPSAPTPTYITSARLQSDKIMDAYEYTQSSLAALRSNAQASASSPSLVANFAVNSLTSAINSAMSIESNNKSYRNMVNSKAAASVTTTGNSAVRLRPYQRLVTYTKTLPSEELSNLYWVFYYTGYSHPVQEKPNFTSRYWFNYVSCRPVFNNENITVYSDYLDEIKQRFEAGVTVYHTHDGKWDINQQYENGEVGLYR